LWLHFVFFVWIFINWFSNYFEIKNWKINHYIWIIFKKKDIFLINEITSINLYQSFFWRIFNYWNIELFYNDKKFLLKDIPNPEKYIDYIELYKDNILFTK
jgi:hypothetical protein